jgi:putative heme-binding domain-containing protein
VNKIRIFILSIILVFGFTLAARMVSKGLTPFKLAPGWQMDLVSQAPAIQFPTAIVQASDGTIYLGQDPMDMPGPPTEPADSVVAIKDGRVTVFAEKLWAVMGLEWVDDTLYVVHAPYLSAFRDTDGDGKADERIDLVTGLGPEIPGFDGLNDHVASGIRLGIDGFLYIAVGDKGIPKGVGRDGRTIRLAGGGVIRVRPDGSDLEIVSTGERNPLSVALTASDEIFTYGNDDDSKKWPNSLTHHIVGGHYGYPYEFLNAPDRALPILDGRIGGAGAQGICYNEDGLARRFRGNLFFCDWGLQAVVRYEVARSGGTFKVESREYIVRKGTVGDFRPFSLAVGDGGKAIYLVDWAYNGFLAAGPKTGRLYRLTYSGPDRVEPALRPAGNHLVSRQSSIDRLLGAGLPTPPSPRPQVSTCSAGQSKIDGARDDQLASLEHSALSIRLAAQHALASRGSEAEGALVAKLEGPGPGIGRIHVLWALDSIGTLGARLAIRNAIDDADDEVRIEAIRSAGIRRDNLSLSTLIKMLGAHDPVTRREAAIALGRIGDPAAMQPLMTHFGDRDPFVAWSIRRAIRTLDVPDVSALSAALRDRDRRDDALKLCDEWWSVQITKAMVGALADSADATWRAKLVATLAGLYRRYPEWGGYWFGPNPLAGEFPRKTRDWDPEGMDVVFEGLTKSLRDPDRLVRRNAIIGLAGVGSRAVRQLRQALEHEPDPSNLALLVRTLGDFRDDGSIPSLTHVLLDATRPNEVREAALGALESFESPAVSDSLLALIRDPRAPEALVAQAIIALGRHGSIPPSDLSAFLDHPAAFIRAAAVKSLAARGEASEELCRSIFQRLGDSAPQVRIEAIKSLGKLKVRWTIPEILRLANDDQCRPAAINALLSLPDPRALSAYLDALSDRDPDLRRAAIAAILAVRESVSDELESRVRAGQFSGTVALDIERILSRFLPITNWKIIGPYPKNVPQVFDGATTIDFARKHVASGGRLVEWKTTQTDPSTGSVGLENLKDGSRTRDRSGYAANGSPDLAAFAYAEIFSERDRAALFMIGSSGTISIWVNRTLSFHSDNDAGRPYSPDSDLCRISLTKGVNRILVRTREGIGAWSFSLQVSDQSRDPSSSNAALASITPGEMQAYALAHPGDSKKGEALFFEPGGIGCAKCHAVGAQGGAHVGPDLRGLALKYDKQEIIRSVLMPSERIANGYQTVVLAKTDGTVLTGQLRAESSTHLEILLENQELMRVPMSEIEVRRNSDKSLMPTNLVDSLTREDFSNLISYLSNLTR